MQIYKILSIYSTIAPPAAGNCTVRKEEKRPLISLQELKSIFSKPEETALIKIKNALQLCINDADWDFEEVIEHDYALPDVTDCVLYYLTGYISTTILKRMNCDVCKNAIMKHRWHTREEFLIDFHSKLIHPNTNFFHFIKYLEKVFAKHCHKSNVLDLVLLDITTENILSFPCSSHKNEVVPFIVYYFLQMRMRQLCKISKMNQEKENQSKKKLSRLAKT